MTDSTKLDILVVLYSLQCDLATGVADPKIDLAETASPQSVLDRVAVEWFVALLIAIVWHQDVFPWKAGMTGSNVKPTSAIDLD